MSTTFFSEKTESHEQELAPYRTMSRSAMLSLIFGVLSALGMLAPALIGFAFFGVLFCFLGLRAVRRYPAEYSGRAGAIAGGVLSVLLALSAASYHIYVYQTEVPDGYDRISFKVLQAKDGASPLMPVPKEAVDLDGKKIFVGGYIHPDAGMEPVQSFVLVPDMGTCCFGGQPELTDMIEVTLQGKDQVRYSMRKRKLCGTLRVTPMLKPREKLTGTYYQLTVDEVVR